MKLKTKHFGELEISEDIIINFEEGIPGFPNTKHFVILEEPEEVILGHSEVFYWLQSVEETDVSLIIMDLTKVMPDYNPLINTEEIKSLGSIETEVFYFYNVVVLPDEIEKMSVNLRAPIVINDRLKKGKQVLSENDGYPIRYYILQELNRKM